MLNLLTRHALIPSGAKFVDLMLALAVALNSKWPSLCVK